MNVITRCPSCGFRVSFAPSKARDSGVKCARCAQPLPVVISDRIANENTVDVCPTCSKQVFYVQRDFNRNLGLAIVIVCAVIGLVFVYYDRPLMFYASLGGGVLIDVALYAVLPDVTICYACKAIFRDATRNPQHGPFDLHIADHFERRSQG